MASVTLDFSEGHIGEPLEPDIDDLGRANEVIAARRNGGQVTASDSTGALGTATIGIYRTQVDVNPLLDVDLPNHANYHLILGTDPDPRFPQVVVDLDANPDLATTVSVIDIGDLLELTNIPAELGQPEANLLVSGYTEVIGSHRRVITFNTRQGAILSNVGQLDGDATACLQTAGAELSAAITAEQVEFGVVTTSEPLFTTSPPTGAQILVGGREIMTVTQITSAVRDTFTRTEAAGSWGMSDSLHTYQLSGTATDFSVNGSQGIIAPGAVNAERHATVNAGMSGIQDARIWCTFPAVPTGAPINWGILLRYTDANNYYWADVQVSTTSTLTLRLIKRVSSVITQITTFTSNVAHSTTVPRVLRAFYDPATGLLASRLWSSDVPEPNAWHVSTTDTAVPAGTRVGAIARLMTGNTNVSPQMQFDNFALLNPQTFTVTRDPDQRRTHAAESAVNVYRPLRLTL